MHRYVRSGDYFPTPRRHQYRYFYPTPVLPATTYTSHRTHFFDSFGHGHEPGHQKILEDRKDREVWKNIMEKGGGLESETTAVREHSLKKVLPWRSAPVHDVNTDTSLYTGRAVRFSDDTDIFGTPLNDKFPDLVSGSNILAPQGQYTYPRCQPKHSPTEWNFNNKQLCSGADNVHNQVMMVKSQARHCVGRTGKNTLRHKSDTHEEIEKRIRDIKKWTAYLKDELQFNIAQAHELLELKERLELMLKNIEEPLQIAQENLYMRETRQGAELVQDQVEDCLLREIETLRRCEEKLLDEMDKLNAHLTKLRTARHGIELDIQNKEQAISTDECVRLLTELSDEIGTLDIPKGMGFGNLSSPSSWLANTQALIHKSQEERSASQLFYAALTRRMMDCANDCFGVWYATNAAFGARVAEISHAKRHLERHLEKIKNDIDVLKKHMDDVNKALDEKRPLLQLAQSRMEKRKERPGIELCRDEAMISLLREMHALKIAIKALNDKLAEMEAALQNLLKTKGALEHDLRLKNAALFIDREKCLCLRQTFPISTFKEVRYAKADGPSGDTEPMTR